jgi:hypothetical protein
MDKPVMATVATRPTKVQHKLPAMGDTLVQCRLANGEDVYIPLKEIYLLFEKELTAKMRFKDGLV